MKVWAIVVAGGAGRRLGPGEPKAFRDVAGKPMVDWSLEVLGSHASIAGIVLVVPQGATSTAAAARATVVPGGASRRESVAAGLQAVPADADVIVVHDAARPLISAACLDRSLQAIERGADGAICALPASDTLKRVTGDQVVATVARDELWRAQTPQAFRAQILRDAHAGARGDATDDAALVEAAGGTVVVVLGDVANFKITTADDLDLAERLLGPAPGARTGIGYDAHGFADGRRLMLGGVEIEGARGLAGHSDADVLCHAIADAILGGAALGDLGTHFPSGDRRWAGAEGVELLRRAAALVAERGFTVGSVDATVILQAPAIAPYREAMRARIADALEMNVARVSVKATTTDGFGVTGRGEAAAAMAVAVLEPARR